MMACAMLGIRNMYEQRHLTAAAQNMKRIAKAFWLIYLLLLYLHYQAKGMSSVENMPFVGGLGSCLKMHVDACFPFRGTVSRRLTEGGGHTSNGQTPPPLRDTSSLGEARVICNHLCILRQSLCTKIGLPSPNGCATP